MQCNGILHLPISVSRRPLLYARTNSVFLLIVAIIMTFDTIEKTITE